MCGLHVKTETNTFFVKMKESALGRAGPLCATAMQFPVRMARLGVEAVVEFVRTGRKPVNTPGLDFHDTGVTLVTDEPARSIPSISAKRALKDWWG